MWDDNDRTELFEADMRDGPSPAFSVTDAEHVVVAVISDPFYRPNDPLFGGVAEIYARLADAEPGFYKSRSGDGYARDLWLSFDGLDSYTPLVVDPGEYQLYSLNIQVPIIEVVTCPA